MKKRGDTTTDASEIRDKVIGAVIGMIRETKGRCITFKTTDIAKRLGLKKYPVVCRAIHEALTSIGGVKIWRDSRNRGRVYMITDDSPLWEIAKSLR